jgi:hypothetical protein
MSVLKIPYVHLNHCAHSRSLCMESLATIEVSRIIAS